MAQKRLLIPEIGEVILTRRRGNRNIRLSIGANGQVRVGMPYWTSFEAGLLFAKRKKDWIQSQLVLHAPKPLRDGSRIGKAHQLIYHRVVPSSDVLDVRATATTVEVRSSLDITDPRVQKQASEASELALKMESKQLLLFRLAAISTKHQLNYRHVRIRKLTSRWGSCSNQKDITLSYFLIQLPWELIDYVILHELAHTKFPNHNPNFWQFMEEGLPNARLLRKQIKAYKPRLEPY